MIAEAVVHRDGSDSESESVLASVEDSDARTRGSAISKKPQKPTKHKRKSRYDVLENKMDSKFEEVGGKMDIIMKMLKSNTSKNSAENGDVNSERIERSQRRSEPVCNISENEDDKSDNDDNISIRPKQGETLGNDSDILSDVESDNEQLSETTKKCLFDIFGDDALPKKSEKKKGIVIDDAQKEVLSNSWRSVNPNNISAFSEEHKEEFLVHEDTETFLQVPSIDDLVSRCIVKKHGKKASSTKTGRTLFSQPCKMVEKTAYRGQQACYMGIVMHMYMQQALGDLLQNLQSETVNISKAVQQVRDIFAISTKSLDQCGRTGAFHHIIRRQLAMTDTSLYEIDDARDLSNLPLTNDGIFGSELEKFLKSRKEKNKMFDDLLPDIPKKDSGKRKSSSNADAPASKKACVEKDKSNDRIIYNSNFSRPSTSSAVKNFDKKYESKGTGQKVDNFRIPKRNSNSSRGGKTSRK